MIRVFLLSFSGLFLLSSGRPCASNAAEPPGDLTPTQIVAQSKQAQESWEDEVAELAFLIVDKGQNSTLRLVTRKRKKWRKREGIDTKTVLLLKYPHKYFGFAYLSWSYLDPAAHDRKWIYYADDLSSTNSGRGRRVRSLVYDMGETFVRSLFEGNDFTYEDLSERPLEADTHRILGEEFYNNKDCYRIESIPKEEGHFYQRKISWIWKDFWLPIKVDFHDHRGKPFRTQHNHWTKTQGIWTLKQSTMKDLMEGEMTILFTKSAIYNTGLRDGIFVPVALETAR